MQWVTGTHTISMHTKGKSTSSAQTTCMRHRQRGDGLRCAERKRPIAQINGI